MLRDITIGQYFPGHSFIHKMDPRMKLIAAVLYIIVLFVASQVRWVWRWASRWWC